MHSCLMLLKAIKLYNPFYVKFFSFILYGKFVIEELDEVDREFSRRKG